MSDQSAAQSIIKVEHNAWRVATAQSSGVLVDAADYYRAFVKAAEGAKRSIVMSGWQFDSGVPLLRGDDAPAGKEVRLLKYLNGLCEKTPELEIYILAWDFHLVFALEREWMQKLLFHWKTNERLHFRFDETSAEQGSHHQKFVVIDRSVSFLGGIDLCEARWDDRRHLARNPLRLSHDKPSKPYHDVQAYLAGCDTADVLRELFQDRWARAEGKPLSLGPCEESDCSSYQPDDALPLGRQRVAVSRTDPRSKHEAIREVEALFMGAIAAAETLIYAETQYFSSRAICGALMRRMRERRGQGLEIVIILNEKAEAVKEEIAVGLRQAKNLKRLRRVAAATGTALGLYFTRSADEGAPSKDGGDAAPAPTTYIHTKLLAVDDRFLTIGSANLTNRSMGVDSELHVSWEATGEGPDDRRLRRGIRRVRVSLLAEHSGLGGTAVARLVRVKGLVAALDRIADEGPRLCHHRSPTEKEQDILKVIDPQALPFDPERPQFNDDDDTADDETGGETETHAEEAAQSRPLFIGGLAALWERLRG